MNYPAQIPWRGPAQDEGFEGFFESYYDCDAGEEIFVYSKNSLPCNEGREVETSNATDPLSWSSPEEDPSKDRGCERRVVLRKRPASWAGLVPKACTVAAVAAAESKMAEERILDAPAAAATTETESRVMRVRSPEGNRRVRRPRQPSTR